MAGKVYEIAFQLAGRLASSFSGSFRAANSAMAGLARGQKQLASSTQQATAAWNRQAEATTKATAAMAKHAAALARVQSFRKKMSAAAVPAAALTAGLGAGAMAIIKKGADYQQQITQAGAIAGADQQEMAALDKTAQHLGATTEWTSAQVASGMTNLAMAGLKTNQIVAAMPGQLSLATAAQTDLASTTDIAVTAMTGFGLKASDMGRIGDVLAAGFTNSATNLTQLGDAMKYVAPVAGKVGLSIEQTTAALGVLANAGRKGSQGGTDLQRVISRLLSNNKNVNDALSKLGVKVHDAKGELKDLPTLFREINDSMTKHGLSDADRATGMSILFGEEGLAGGLTLMKAAADHSWDAMVAKENNAAGTAQAIADKMKNTVRGDILALSSAWDGAMQGIFNSSDKNLRGVIQSVTNVVTSIGSWIVENPQLTRMIVQFTAALGGVAIAIGAINAAMALNPVVLIVGAIGALVAALAVAIANWDYFKAAVLDAWNSFAAAVSGAWNTAVALVSSIGSSISQVFQEMWANLTQAASSAWDAIIALASAKGAELLASITEAFTSVVQTIQNLWDGVKAFFSDLWGSIASGFTSMVNGIISGINRIVAGLNSLCSFKVPDWVPGIGGKGFQAKIPEVPKMATGGVVTDPTLALLGEGASPEAVVPLDRLSSFLGSSSGGVGGITISFSPVINLSGGSTAADPYAEVRRGLSAGAEDLKKQLERVLADQRRLSYS